MSMVMEADSTKEMILHGLIILSILMEPIKKPMHCYAIQKDMHYKIGRNLPHGSVYVLLKPMKNRGSITSVATTNEKGHQLLV